MIHTNLKTLKVHPRATETRPLIKEEFKKMFIFRKCTGSA